MDELRRDVSRMRALLFLDLVDPSAVIDWAGDLDLRVGRPEGLATLAELTDARREDVGAQLAVVADELGLEALSERVAGVDAAEDVARRLVGGTVAPIEAARRIWRIATLAPSAMPQLRVFIGLASEWEDDPDNRSTYEEEIRSEALRLAGWPE
jgi:hypothetical protein